MRSFKKLFALVVLFSLVMVACEKEGLAPGNDSGIVDIKSESIENFVKNNDILLDENAILQALNVGEDLTERSAPQSMVYTMGNQAAGNEVIAFKRDSDGKLTESGRYKTGGTGTDAGLGNQGALDISNLFKLLFVVNPGSNDFSVFYIKNDGSLILVGKMNSGGMQPISITYRHGLIYVLNAGREGNISGFGFNKHGQLSAISNSTRPLSTIASGPAQVSFSGNGRSLIITEKATNTITSYQLNNDGRPNSKINTFPSAGMTPFGFAVGNDQLFYVSEASGGAAGASTVSSYKISNSGKVSLVEGPFALQTSAVCWAVLSKNNKDLFLTNTASGSISSISVSKKGQLSFANGGKTTPAVSGPLDAALDDSGKFLYVLAAGGMEGDDAILSYKVMSNGSLEQIDEDRGSLPNRVSGIVVRSGY